MDKGTIARTSVLLIALVNQVLTMFGWNPLPWSDEQVYTVVTGVLTVGATLVAWWKNNYVSKKGKAQRKVLKEKGLH
ncbi:SPP1 family holin [Scopulibacillus darangshiensis]|uniref:SPP1 family holin n=1 Tax=Scopulibacillus darangshiensis TaxID=442528 RepID=A0A4R2P563_9BACL|nr:phage holin [Scopulibacillus darangshiensis]TCP29912.1 SPP1 family holin [Scopulibacillus darangshiensis]